MGAMTDQETSGLTEADLTRWLEAYGKAWEQKSPDAAAALFTEDASYRQTPYEDPFPGRAAIREYWTSITADQTGIDFSFEPIAVSGMTGIAQWSTRFRTISGDTPVELNGVFVLEFADPEQVSALREWWHVR